MKELDDVTTMKFPIKVNGVEIPQTMAMLQKFIQSIVNYKADEPDNHQKAQIEAQLHLLALIDARIEAAKKQGKI